MDRHHSPYTRQTAELRRQGRMRSLFPRATVVVTRVIQFPSVGFKATSYVTSAVSEDTCNAPARATANRDIPNEGLGEWVMFRMKRRRKSLGQSRNQRNLRKNGKPKNLLCHLRSPGVPNSSPIIVKVRVDDCLISMEVDTDPIVAREEPKPQRNPSL